MVSCFTFFFACCFNYGLFACFCHELTFNQPGVLDHSVFDTFVQLTGGRSARDQPKQPPAKKNALRFSFLPFSPFFSIGFSLSFLHGLVPPVGFSLNFIPIFALSEPAWAYCPARSSSLSSAYYLFLCCFSFFLPSSISFPFLKVFAQSGFAQRGNTL